jgi:leader peptidase (prepilin peptidase)/N-methyltransferase
MLDVLFASAPLLYAGVFVLGAVIGSFLNVVILRLPPLLEYDWRCQCRELLAGAGGGSKPDHSPRRASCSPARSAPVAATDRPRKCPPFSFLPAWQVLGLRRISPRYPASSYHRHPVRDMIWHFGPTARLTALLLTGLLIVWPSSTSITSCCRTT